MPLWHRDIHPSEVVNATHQGALVTIAASFCLCCSLLFFCARMLLRWPWRALFRIDDAIAAFSTAISVVQVGITIRAVNDGLGTASKLLSADALVAIKQILYAGNILYVLSLYVGKASVGVLFLRLAVSKNQVLYSKAVLVACGVSCLVSILIIALEPNITSPWLAGSSASSSVTARWIAVETIASILEVLIASLPVYLVTGLQMHTNVKVKVVLGVWSRLPLVVVAILRIVSLSRLKHQSDVIFSYVWPEIYLQVEMSYNLISATIPGLRSFWRKAKSGILGGIPDSLSDGTRMATVGTDSFQHTYLQRRRDSRQHTYGVELSRMTPVHTIASAMPEDHRPSMASDSSRRAIVVRQTIDVQYMENTQPDT